MRPEALRHHKRLIEDISIASEKKTLLILPESDITPFHKSPFYIKLVDALGDALKEIQICFLALPFGIIPVEISDVYPLSQYVNSIELDRYAIREMLKRVREFVSKYSFEKIILLNHLDSYSPIFKRMAKVIKNCHVIDALIDDNFDKMAEEILMDIAKAKS